MDFLSESQAFEIRMAIVTRIQSLTRLRNNLENARANSSDPNAYSDGIAEVSKSIERQKECYDSLFTRPIAVAFPNL